MVVKEVKVGKEVMIYRWESVKCKCLAFTQRGLLVVLKRLARPWQYSKVLSVAKIISGVKCHSVALMRAGLCLCSYFVIENMPANRKPEQIRCHFNTFFSFLHIHPKGCSVLHFMACVIEGFFCHQMVNYCGALVVSEWVIKYQSRTNKKRCIRHHYTFRQ